jgi:hypothetical protein
MVANVMGDFELLALVPAAGAIAMIALAQVTAAPLAPLAVAAVTISIEPVLPGSRGVGSDADKAIAALARTEVCITTPAVGNFGGRILPAIAAAASNPIGINGARGISAAAVAHPQEFADLFIRGTAARDLIVAEPALTTSETRSVTGRVIRTAQLLRQFGRAGLVEVWARHGFILAATIRGSTQCPARFAVAIAAGLRVGKRFGPRRATYGVIRPTTQGACSVGLAAVNVEIAIHWPAIDG